MDGWVKLHRKILNSDMYQNLNSAQRDVLITLLLMANHEPKKWEWRGEIYEVLPGQLITSLENIKRKCAKNVTIRNVRTALLKLEKWGFLTNKATKSGRLITIINWGTYQSNEEKTDKETDKQVTNNRQTSDKQVTTNKNDKNVKNEKNNNTSKKSDDFLTIAYSILEKWNAFAQQNGLSKINVLTPQRKQKLKIRLKEKEFDFDRILKNILESEFLLGVNKTGWKVSFDFIIRSQDTYTKILEGEYASHSPKRQDEIERIKQNRAILEKQGINPDKFPELRLN